MTIFHGLYQGIIGEDDDAVLVSVHSTPEVAEGFKKTLSDQHTEEKREAVERPGGSSDEVPDLYWDIRPVAFDPRSIDELV